MTQWYVKELSKLTQVSVQTLHHYDRIDLLKPSIRLATNSYRLYSEKDLLKLQQIIALKFFGFELSQIKTLLSSEVDIIEHFSIQSQLLEKKASTLFEASETLKKIISDCNNNKSIPWETIIKLIEVYRMTQQLEKTWAGKALNQEELKQYVNFEQAIKTKFTDK
jgi:DNA-binding transcriptional MerR regulator